jgi:hypothetical protein
MAKKALILFSLRDFPTQIVLPHRFQFPNQAVAGKHLGTIFDSGRALWQMIYFKN